MKQTRLTQLRQKPQSKYRCAIPPLNLIVGMNRRGRRQASCHFSSPLLESPRAKLPLSTEGVIARARGLSLLRTSPFVVVSIALVRTANKRRSANVLTQPDVKNILHRRSRRRVQDAAPGRQETDGEFHRHASHEETLISDHVFPQEKNAGDATIPLENPQ